MEIFKRQRSFENGKPQEPHLVYKFLTGNHLQPFRYPNKDPLSNASYHVKEILICWGEKEVLLILLLVILNEKGNA